MRSNSRSVVILICLFLISFKVAASSVFIEVAIERVEMYKSYQLGTAALEIDIQSDPSDDKQDACTLFLMSHVTASVSSTGIHLPDQVSDFIHLGGTNHILFTQNIPDSAFKPPRIIS